jgi:hypothetical protein
MTINETKRRVLVCSKCEEIIDAKGNNPPEGKRASG